ncbi:hypothetical protein KAJ27_25165 [bacterium]|nr:hypothetical protein [bacterium]
MKKILFCLLLITVLSNLFAGYVFDKKIGIKGNDKLEFNYPVCLFYKDSKIFISDWKNSRVQAITEDGRVQLILPEIKEPVGIVVNSKGEIIVASKLDSVLYKYDKAGNLITKIGKEGVKKGQFYHPRGLGIDKSDNVYVCDYGNKRIQKLNPFGEVIKVYEYFNPKKRLVSPRGIFVADDDFLYITYEGNVIVKMDQENKIVKEITGKTAEIPDSFNGLRYICVDHMGNIFVSDYKNNRVIRLDRFGKMSEVIGTKGSSDGKLLSPEGLIILYDGSLWVANGDNDRIEVFKADDYLKYFSLAKFYKSLGDNENTYKYYEKAYACNPGESENIKYLEKEYQKRMTQNLKVENYEKALYYCEKIIEINPARRENLLKKAEDIKFQKNRWIYVICGTVLIFLLMFIFLFFKLK